MAGRKILEIFKKIISMPKFSIGGGFYSSEDMEKQANALTRQLTKKHLHSVLFKHQILSQMTADELIDYINGRNDIKVYGDIQKVELIKETMAKDGFTQEAIDYFLQMDLTFLNNETWADMLENSDFRAITGCKMYNRED